MNLVEGTMNIVEALSRQVERGAAIRERARGIGPAGAFLVAQLTASLDKAHKAAGSGDIVLMATAYKDLEGYKE